MKINHEKSAKIFVVVAIILGIFEVITCGAYVTFFSNLAICIVSLGGLFFVCLNDNMRVKSNEKLDEMLSAVVEAIFLLIEFVIIVPAIIVCVSFVVIKCGTFGSLVVGLVVGLVLNKLSQV